VSIFEIGSITEGDAMVPKNRKPSHPGEILLEEFLKPLEMSQVELARRMGVPIQRINTLTNGKRDMTAETAILLSRSLKTSSEFWMNLQVALDLYQAQRTMEHAA
jgi:antitoxin HigA-1